MRAHKYRPNPERKHSPASASYHANMQLPRCPVTGKLAHASKSSAKKQVKSIAAASGTKGYIYLCPYEECQGYHVTRRPPAPERDSQ